MKMRKITGCILTAIIVLLIIGNTGFAQPVCPTTSCTDSDNDKYTPDTTCNTDPGCASCKCGDCNDLNPTVYDGAPELCDGLDTDCDGAVPDEEKDHDGDAHVECNPNGLTQILGNDCNDLNPTVYDGAPELCDGLDNDCDGAVPDEEKDHDGDGYVECNPNGLTQIRGNDCNDTNPNVNPNATEICDGIDNNCNGVIDEGVKNICTDYATCSNYTTCGECPAEPPELCDGIDNNCNGAVDEGATTTCMNYTTCTSYAACGQCPAAPPETCNGIDDDCNSQVDEIFFDLGQQCGTGACAGVKVCNPSGNGTICNGTAPSVELCANSIDDDCDETTDCDDTDCAANPSCANTACKDSGVACTETEQCCNDLKCKKILYSRPSSRICCDKDECATTAGCVDENTCAQDHLRKVCGKGIWLPETRIERNCNDGVDNDCDGKIDCKDSDCRYFPKCKSVLQCRTNSDCLSNEACKKGTCTILICNGCKYAGNHQCNDMDCCSKKDCNRGEVCLSHKCRKMPLNFELQKEYLRQSVESAIENAGQKIKDKKDGGYDSENLSELEDKFMKAATAYNRGDYDNAESFAVQVISDGENTVMNSIYSIIRKIKLVFSGTDTAE